MKKQSLSKKLQENFDSHIPKVWTKWPQLLCAEGIPRPMHGLNPRNILGNNWRVRIRQAACDVTENHCHSCGIIAQSARFNQYLEGHEVYDIDYLLGRMIYVETVAICYCCHSFIHQGRIKNLVDKGVVRQDRYAAIIQHGDRVLLENGLERKHYIGPIADWQDWRLVLFDEEYQPKYKSIEEWKIAYAD